MPDRIPPLDAAAVRMAEGRIVAEGPAELIVEVAA